MKNATNRISRFKFVGLQAKNSLIFSCKQSKLLMLSLKVINQCSLLQPYDSTIVKVVVFRN